MNMDQREEWSIELLRGAAAMMVVFAHYYVSLLHGSYASFMSFTMTGVDLFFVISGYVFAPYFLGKQIDSVAFFVRRFFRIYPLYVIVLLGYVALHAYHGLGTEHILAHLLFLHTATSAEIALYYNFAFWSLPPEIEFYLLLPFLALLVRRIWPLVCLTVAALILAAWIGYMAHVTRGAAIVWTGLKLHLPGLFIEFLLGALAGFINAKLLSSGIRALLLTCGVGFWLILATTFASGAGKTMLANLVADERVFAAFAFAIMTCGWVGFIKKPPVWLRQGAIAFGNLSYGIYLIHNAIPLALKNFASTMPASLFATLCLLITVVASFLAHLLVESPLRQIGRNLAARIESNHLQGRMTSF